MDIVDKFYQKLESMLSAVCGYCRLPIQNSQDRPYVLQYKWCIFAPKFFMPRKIRTYIVHDKDE